MVLHWGQFYPPGDIWQCLGTMLVVMIEGRDPGIYWVEVRHAAKHLLHRPAPQQRIIWPKISVVPSLRN